MALKHGTRYAAWIVLMSSAFNAVGGECGTFPVAVFKTVKGSQHEEWSISLPRTLMSSQPQWSSGEVPLTPNQTRTIVTSWAKKSLPKYDGVHIKSYQLRPYECPDLRDHWFYIVDVIPTVDGHAVPDAARSVAVTLDGNIVEAKPTKN